MAISKKVDLKIKESKATLSEKIIIYKNDKGIDIYFNLLELNYSFSDGMENVDVSYIIKQPNDKIITQDGLSMINGEIKLTITESMIDEIEEVGTHTLQFVLYDSIERINRVTIPEVTFEVKESLFNT